MSITVSLDCGAIVQVLPTGNKFQLVEVREAEQTPRAIPVGGTHSTIWGAIEEIRKFDLNQYECLTLDELLSAVKSTNQQIREYFEQHSEYLNSLN